MRRNARTVKYFRKESEWTCMVLCANLTANSQPRMIEYGSVVEVEQGERAVLPCLSEGHPSPKHYWYRLTGHGTSQESSSLNEGEGSLALKASDRVFLLPEGPLILHKARIQDNGRYVCVANNSAGEDKAHVELLVTEDAPALEHVFSERQLRPGGSVSLRCSASGNPLPQVTWSLDGTPVPEHYHVRVGDYVSGERLVHSYVNLTGVRVEDGGIYTCIARNGVGHVSHSARLNVLGRPLIRPMANVTALAGRNMRLHCAVAGHPIQSIVWQKDGRSLPQNHRQHSFPNGSLVITEVQRSVDSGWYACVARDPQGNTARGQLAVHVMSDFPDDLTEGKRAGAACIISEGDLPITIEWLKDGLPLHPELEASVAKANDYTSFLSFTGVRQLHSGNYTCVASNPATSSNYSAEMIVRGTESGREFAVIISNANVQILENGSLSIREADRLDAGHYMCQALNGVGPGISTVVKLDVHVAAHFERKFHALTVRRGDNVALTCRAVGEPPITVTWLRDRNAFSPALEPRHLEFSFRVHYDTEPHCKIRHGPVPGTWKRDSRLSVIDATETSHVISSLRPKTAYEFRLRAENAIGLSEFSDSLMVTTDEEAPSGAPRDIKVTPTGSRSIRITWKPPLDEDSNDLVQGYYVGYRVRDAKESFAYKTLESSAASSLQQCELTDLRRNTRYSVVVQAFNAKGAGPVSEEVHSQTLEIGFVLFHKVEPPAPADAQSAEDASEWSEVQTGSERSAYAYRGLRCGRKYSFYVVAFNAAGRGPRSNVVHAKTDGSVTLQLGAWKSGGCPISSFTILYKPQSNKDWSPATSAHLVPDQQQPAILVIPDLMPATWYDLLVTAQNDAGATEAEYVFATLTLSGEDLDEAQQVTKSIDTVPMSVWEKPNQQSNYKDQEQHAAMEREQLYYPSPYDAGGRRLAPLYAPEGLHTGWASAQSLNGAAEEPEDERTGPHHTYDVPFLRSLPNCRQDLEQQLQMNAEDELMSSTERFEKHIYSKPAIVYMSPEKCSSLRKSLQAGNIIESYPNGNASYVYSRPKKKHWRNHDEELLYAEHKLRKLSRYADELKQAQMSAKDSVLETGVEAYELSEAECDMPTRRFAMQR
ncbi:hypothetical protein MRX96_024048 [Rhipicephalus microplus]